MSDDTSAGPFKPWDKKFTRFVFGTNVFREGQPVVEVYDGDSLMAAIYPSERGIRIVSRHFAQPLEFDPIDPPTLTVRFVGTSPPGRERLGNGPVEGKEDGDE